LFVGIEHASESLVLTGTVGMTDDVEADFTTAAEDLDAAKPTILLFQIKATPSRWVLVSCVFIPHIFKLLIIVSS
jgi:hypothetical protein